MGPRHCRCVTATQEGRRPLASNSIPSEVLRSAGEAYGRPSMAVHVVLNQKGGVGKSTIAVNLAAVTADVCNDHDDPDATSPVAAISVDPQGSAVWWASRIDDLPFHIVQ